MLRYLNTFARHIWLIIIPLLILPLPLTVLLKSTSTVRANLWVEQPLYVASPRPQEGAWDSNPASQVATLFTELMSTRTFLGSVMDSSPTLSAQVKSDSDRQAALDAIASSVKSRAGGWRLISLTINNSDNPQQDLEVLNAVVNKFMAYYDDRIKTQNASAVAFYKDQLNKADQTLQDATGKIDSFLKDHPELNPTGTTTNAVTPAQLEFVGLAQNRDAARKNYDDTKIALDRVQASYAAYLQGQDTTLKVQDKPEAFGVPGEGKFRSILIAAGISLVAGGILIVALTVILTWLDRSLRQPYYAQQLLQVKVLNLPEIRPARGWRKTLAVRQGRAGAKTRRFRLRPNLAKQVNGLASQQLPGDK